MNRKLRNILLAAALFALLLSPSLFNSSIRWARSLKAEDIAALELVIMPSTEQERYRLFAPEEYAEPVELINESCGIYILFPIPKTGNSHALYVTLMDGTRHCVVNSSSGYLTIDGDVYYYPHYERVLDWIEAHDLALGNAKTPDGFWERN